MLEYGTIILRGDMRKRRRRQNQERNLYIRFLALVGAIIVILVLTYFAGIAVLGNLNVFLGTPAPTPNTSRERVVPPPKVYSLPQATYSGQIKVEGYAQPGSRVTLFVNENEIESLVSNKDGQYTFDQVSLKKGENQIYVVAKDSEGTESKPSNTATVVFDDQPPKLTIENPKDNQIIKEDKKGNTFVMVKGSVSERATVTVNGQQAIINQDNEFEHRLNLSKEGENIIKIIARDRAGNETVVEKTIIYKKLEEGKAENGS
jgi:hypothetical protein